MKGQNQLPILIIIPHGGYNVPEELFGYEAVSKFDLFMQSDTCANDLFSFGDRVAATMDTDISRLFIDLDRAYTSLRNDQDGVIKKSTRFGKPVFRDDHFPDDIAIANMIQRYWAPFHDTINKIINTGSLRLILECHTMMAVGPKMSRDPGMPRPLFMIENLVREKEMSRETCSTGMTGGLMEQVEKSFAGEKNTITEKFVISDTPADGFIMKSYGNRGIPMLRISLAQSLFLNDAHFSYDYLRVDDLRIQHIRKSMRESIERFCHKCL